MAKREKFDDSHGVDDSAAEAGSSDTGSQMSSAEGDATAITVKDQNGDALATVDKGDEDHVHLTIGGVLHRLSHDTVKALREALSIHGSQK